MIAHHSIEAPMPISEEDFYPRQQSWWDQVADNLARWLGQPHVTVLDVAILLPLFPLLVLFIIWWAPWEPWVWKNVPKKITGPYLVYCAFAFSHFHANSWLVILVAIIGVVICAIALKEIHDRRTGHS
jgi:hypothetical protein